MESLHALACYGVLLIAMGFPLPLQVMNTCAGSCVVHHQGGRTLTEAEVQLKKTAVLQCAQKVILHFFCCAIPLALSVCRVLLAVI